MFSPSQLGGIFTFSLSSSRRSVNILGSWFSNNYTGYQNQQVGQLVRDSCWGIIQFLLALQELTNIFFSFLFILFCKEILNNMLARIVCLLLMLNYGNFFDQSVFVSLTLCWHFEGFRSPSTSPFPRYWMLPWLFFLSTLNQAIMRSIESREFYYSIISFKTIEFSIL